MSLRHALLLLFLSSCEQVATDTDTGITMPDLVEVAPSCQADFSDCVPTASLSIGQNDDIPRFLAAATFIDGTSLIFDFEGQTETISGDVKLADGTKGRPLPPMAVLIEPGGNDLEDIIWDTLGQTVQVSFPRPDFIRIEYNLELVDILKLDRPHRFMKGTLTAPIVTKCFTGIPGSSAGTLDPDFSSDYCKEYEKHNHR